MIKIIISSNSNLIFFRYLNSFIAFLKKSSFCVFSGPVHFVLKRKKFCILRSPHVDKDSRDQYEVRTYKVCFFIYLYDFNFLDDVMRFYIPSSIFINIL